MKPTEIHAQWGKRVRQARRQKDITAVAFAAEVGISRTQVHRIESGQQAPSDALRIRIAKALGADPNEIFSYDLKDAS